MQLPTRNPAVARLLKDMKRLQRVERWKENDDENDDLNEQATKNDKQSNAVHQEQEQAFEWTTRATSAETSENATRTPPGKSTRSTLSFATRNFSH